MAFAPRDVLLPVLIIFLSLEGLLVGVEAWQYAHATFYGGNDASGTNNGACGYSNVFALGYGSNTAALSAPLFQNGCACGACYQIMCSGDHACYRNSIVVTATNLCPQGSFGGWCDYPNAHFDLSQPAFSQIAQVSAGHVNLIYQRVNCARSGGMKFNIQGHTYFMQVLVYNVAGKGDVQQVAVRGSESRSWIYLSRSWGQNWQTGSVLDGQALTIAVTTSDGRTVVSHYVAGQYWQYGQTFQGSQF